jgi:Na+/proline symporter
MSCGVIIGAPAVVLAAIFEIDLVWAVALIGVPTVLYTMVGGVQAVAWADVKQMVVIVTALFAVVVVLILRLPVPADDALAIAGATGRMQVFDFSFDLTETYTFWSCMLGGTFLMLSYFGTDQSQVQRYLAAKSVDEARRSLLMSAYWKIPLQALILLIGVLVFVYYLFQTPPLLFNPAHEQQVRSAEPAAYAVLEGRYEVVSAERERTARAISAARDSRDSEAVGVATDAFRAVEAQAEAIRDEALAMAEAVTGKSPRDVNYIMPRFVLGELPIGLVGVFIAAIMAAAMSSVAAELNALSTVTAIDFYRRIVPDANDAHYLMVTKAAAGFWGLFACIVAVFAVSVGSLIEVVNRFGSFFYGSILGVFLLAMIPRGGALGAFVGLIAGMSAVAAVSFGAPEVSFLWHNVIGAVTVVVVGWLVSLATGSSSIAQPSS